MLKNVILFAGVIICLFSAHASAMGNPRTCADFESPGSSLAKKTIYDENDQAYNVLCYFAADEVYTLIESFNKSMSLDTGVAATFTVDSPVNEGTSSTVFPLNNYRLSKSRMNYIASRSELFLASCNLAVNPNQYNAAGASNDFVKGQLNTASKRVLFETEHLHSGIDNCLTASGNAFGSSFTSKSFPTYGRKDIHIHMSVDESLQECGNYDLQFISVPAQARACGVRDYPPNTPDTVNLFGSYNKCTTTFVCSTDNAAITSWWLGKTVVQSFK